MAQQIQQLPCKPKDQSSVPGTYGKIGEDQLRKLSADQ